MRLIAPDREIQVEMIAVLRIGVGTEHGCEPLARTGMQPPQERRLRAYRLSHDRCGSGLLLQPLCPHRIRAFSLLPGHAWLRGRHRSRAGTVGPARASIVMRPLGLNINGMIVARDECRDVDCIACRVIAYFDLTRSHSISALIPARAGQPDNRRVQLALRSRLRRVLQSVMRCRDRRAIERDRRSQFDGGGPSEAL